MNNGETETLKKIARDLWNLFNSITLSNMNKLKEKIQEFNKFMGAYGSDDMETLFVRDIAKELNLFGIPYSWKINSFREFLLFNDYKITDECLKDYSDFEYEDIKAYLDLEIEKL